MTRLRLIGFGSVILLGPAIVASPVVGAKASKPLPNLTVPANRLPGGCVLSPRSEFELVPASLPVTRPDGVTVTTVTPRYAGPLPGAALGNPWVGADPESMGWVRSRMSGGRGPALSAFKPPISSPTDVQDPRQAPDGLTSPGYHARTSYEDVSTWWRQEAVGLSEAYSALYLGQDHDTTVLAVRISPDASPRPALPRGPNVVKIGADVVAVIEPSVTGSCAGAIKTYLTHLHR